MTHKLSLIVLGGSGSKIKQVHLSKKQFICAAVIGVLVLAGMLYGLFDYLTLRTRLLEKNSVERQLSAQNEEVLLQRQQIQKFAQEINDLKENLVALGKFHEKIRVIANLDQPDNQEGLFGVGGSAPEDLDPSVDLNQSHAQLMKEMHQQVNQLDDAVQKQKNTFSHLLGKLEEQKNLLAHTPAIRPAQGYTTSSFSMRQSPFTGKQEFHKGLDIANQPGTPIIATADGVISSIGDNGPLGELIVIDHGYGLVTRYGHIEKALKKSGERVKRGEVIALMGNSGRSTGPHVHYEVRLHGVPVNPEKYILN
ncbi:MAG: M23 family metallopeptidase [Desulfobacteraceae bacterium]|nr:M23 family metallopeptidase [Desulfobacteraceae bacterium]